MDSPTRMAIIAMPPAALHLEARVLAVKSGRHLWLLIGFLAAAPAAAVEYDLSLSGGAIYSDNIGRTVGQTPTMREDTIAELALQLTLERNAGRWHASIASDLQYLKFLDETFNDTLQGQFNGNVEFAIIPDRFRWVVEDNFGQSYIDVLAARTPVNNENFNFFSTGPEVSIPLTPSSDLEFSGRWSSNTYEVTASDSNQLDLQMSVVHRFTDSIAGSLVVRSEEVSGSAGSVTPDYTNRTIYAQVVARGARTMLTTRAGHTQLRDTLTIGGGSLWSLEVNRQFGARSSASVKLGTMVTNEVGSVRFEVSNAGGADFGPTTLFSPGAFKIDYASIVFETASPRNQLRVAVDHRKYFHDVSAGFNRTQAGAGTELLRQFTVRLRAGLTARYEKIKSDRAGYSFDEWSAGAAFYVRFARNFDLRLNVDHFVGASDFFIPGAQRDYEENRASLRIVWSHKR